MPRRTVCNIFRMKISKNKKVNFSHCCQLIFIGTSCILLVGCGSREPQGQANIEAISDQDMSAGGSKNNDRHYRIRAAVTADGLQIEELENDAIHNVEWMKSRGEDQVANSKNWSVFHDFNFVDIQPESGIDFRHYPVDCATRNYKPAHYDHGNGIAAADINNDGKIDLYLVNQVGPNALLLNQGNGQFEDITESANVGLEDRVSVSASFADIDNDGDADLFVTSVREGNKLFENDGNGNFTDITKNAGLDYRGHSSSALFFDFDRDGLLDLFLSNVGRYTSEFKTESKAIRNFPFAYYEAFNDAFAGHLKPDRTETSILYKNMGANFFKDVSDKVGLVDGSWSGAATPVDGNGDLWPDLYITNMQGHDQYYENVNGTKFVSKSRDLFPKTPWGSMGVKVFDFENDGRQDIYVTDMHSDMSENVPPQKEKLKSNMRYPESLLRSEGASIFGNAFYRQERDGSFVEVSDHLGAENYWPWGLSIGDLNADGFEDAFIASSMNFPFRYGINSLLLNDHGKKFVDSEFVLGVEPRRDNRTAEYCFTISPDDRIITGPAKAYYEKITKDRDGKIDVWGALGTRSSVILDVENDGDLDIITNEFGSEPMVLVSNLNEKKPIHFLNVELVGTTSNRDGLGAKVMLYTKSGMQTRFHDGQSGYLSQSRSPLYFGLGDDTSVNKIEIVWPTGKTQVVNGPIEPNQTITVEEEQSVR